MPCFHIVKRIHAKIKASPIKWVGHNVKGHQNKHKQFRDLDPWGKANVIADKDAKAHWQRTRTLEQIHNAEQESEGWTITLNQQKLTKNFEHNIKMHCSQEAIQCYWCNRFAILEQAQHDINWKVFCQTPHLFPSVVYLQTCSRNISNWTKHVLEKARGHQSMPKMWGIKQRPVSHCSMQRDRN